MHYREKYETWLNEPFFDEAFKEELLGLSEDEIEDRFYRDLAFGTGGLRGIIGAGSNRMNRYVIMRVTQGYAQYLNGKYDHPSVAIAYDSRHFSEAFALEAARVLGGNGIRVHLFDRVSSTPELSFAVRELKAQGGIVITASHNPKEYSGYKVYQQTGCQVLPDEAHTIIERVEATGFEAIRRCQSDDPLITRLGEPFFERYYRTITALVDARNERRLKLVYTPLNGAGARPVVEVLRRSGFNPLTVPEQMWHDPDFTTVPYPNPEDPSVFEYARRIGETTGADLLMATDPDADRMGVHVRHQGEFIPLTGNQIGALLCDALLGDDPRSAVVTTIVSSHLCDRIAHAHGARIYKTLTGFKYIGEMMTRFEETDDRFVLGFEESFGYLTSTHARDKDAVNAALMVADLADRLKENGQTLIDALERIKACHGYFSEDLLSYRFEGSSGQKEMETVIARFRALDTLEWETWDHSERTDYLHDETGLPRANVLKYVYGDDSWFAVRPSGTEPKLKIYLSTHGASEEESVRKRTALTEAIERFIGSSR